MGSIEGASPKTVTWGPRGWGSRLDTTGGSDNAAATGRGRMQGDSNQDRFREIATLQQARRFAEAAELYLDLARSVLTVNLALNLGLCLHESGDRERARSR